MSNFVRRVKNRIDMTQKNWNADCHFSKELAFLRVMDELGGRLHLKSLSKWAHKRKDKWILGYLDNKLQPIIQKYQNIVDNGQYTENAPVWVCWWTGEDTAPELVKRCINSIRAKVKNHPVIVLTKNNYQEYLDIPSLLIKLINAGDICLANFSDYLRVSLLEQYGGVWLDATIFLSEEISESYFQYPFFTCKKEAEECNYISKMRWTSFCLGGYRQNPFFGFMRESFYKCWAEDHTSIDYLLVDYLIETAYRNFKWFVDMHNNLPNNNEHKDDLQKAFNEAVQADVFNQVVQPLNKLSWRETYSKRTKEGNESIYGYFLREYK